MMKSLLASLLVASSVQAAEVVLINDASSVISNRDRVTTSIQMNTETGEGTAKIRVVREEIIPIYVGGGWNGPYPGPIGYPFPGRVGYPGPHHRVQYRTIYTTLLNEEIAVPGLSLNGKDSVFRAEDGTETVCGTLGVSRVLKLPTLFLTGNCKVEAKSVRVNGQRRFVAKFVTK